MLLTISQLRYKAFQDCLFERGIKINAELVAEGDYSIESGYQARQKIIESYMHLMMIWQCKLL